MTLNAHNCVGPENDMDECPGVKALCEDYDTEEIPCSS